MFFTTESVRTQRKPKLWVDFEYNNKGQLARPYSTVAFNISSKIALLKCYQSQLNEKHYDDIYNYWVKRKKAERVWMVNQLNS